MYTTMSGQISIRIVPQDGGNAPIGKLADAEVYFHDGLLAGLKLIGFSVWRSRAAGCVTNVTFPARQYSVNGERRSFALLRPGTGEVSAQDAIRAAILEAYDMHEGNVRPGPVDAAIVPPVAVPVPDYSTMPGLLQDPRLAATPAEADARQQALLTAAMRHAGPGIAAPTSTTTTTKDESPCAPSSVGFSF